MLKEILRIIDELGYISKSQLASRLNTTEDMIGMGLDQLIRMGFIVEEKEAPSCSSSCGSCPYQKSCNKTFVKSFEISDKGDNFLRA